MKKIIHFLILILTPLALTAQVAPLGTKMYNNVYIVKGSDTIYIQQDGSYAQFYATQDFKFNGDLYVVDSAFLAALRAGNSTFNGYVWLNDPGTNANSFLFVQQADNAGTTQSMSAQVMYGADPYWQIKVPDNSGAATTVANFHDQKITWFNGAAGVDYVFEFNGETNDGTITYMEDEDRFDFDNAIKFVSAGDGTASWATSSLTGFTSITGTTLTDGVASITGGNASGFGSIGGTTLSISSTGSFGGDVDFNDNDLVDAKLDSTYLTNNTWLRGLDKTGTVVNILKVNSINGYVEPGTSFKLSAIYAEPDAGVTPIYNQAIASSVATTEHAFTMKIDDTELLRGRALSDGAGGITAGSDYVKLKAVYTTQEHYDRATVTTDTPFTSVIPAGYILEYIVFNETAGNAATLDLGTSAGGSQIFLNQTIAASTITTVVINKVFSLSAATTLYLNDDDAGSSWNSASVNVYFVMKKIIE